MSAPLPVLTIERPTSTLVLRQDRAALNSFELRAQVFVNSDRSLASAAAPMCDCEIRGLYRGGSGVLWLGRAAFDVSLGDIENIVRVFGVRDDIADRELKARDAA